MRVANYEKALDIFFHVPQHRLLIAKPDENLMGYMLLQRMRQWARQTNTTLDSLLFTGVNAQCPVAARLNALLLLDDNKLVKTIQYLKETGRRR